MARAGGHAQVASAAGLHGPDRPDSRFLCTHAEFATWAEGRNELRMEYFYREMRRKTGLLMNEGKPEGGQWNFDKENRKPAKGDLFMPKAYRVEPDAITRDVLKLTAERFAGHVGDLEPFWSPSPGRMPKPRFFTSLRTGYRASATIRTRC